MLKKVLPLIKWDFVFFGKKLFFIPKNLRVSLSYFFQNSAITGYTRANLAECFSKMSQRMFLAFITKNLHVNCIRILSSTSLSKKKGTTLSDGNVDLGICLFKFLERK